MRFAPQCLLLMKETASLVSAQKKKNPHLHWPTTQVPLNGWYNVIVLLSFSRDNSVFYIGAKPKPKASGKKTTSICGLYLFSLP